MDALTPTAAPAAAPPPASGSAAGAVLAPRLAWRVATVAEVVPETPRVRTLRLDVPGWPGHRAGQHVDVRLTAPDGYQVERSYSIASAPAMPDAPVRRIELTVERLEGGEVSPYLTDELRPGDGLELRGPIGGYFTWTADDGGPLFLVAGGSGVVPLAAMARARVAHQSAAHERAAGGGVPARLLYSARTAEDLIFRAELDALGAGGSGFEVAYALTREHPAGWGGRGRYARRVDGAMLADAGWDAAARPHVFVCGPTPFVEAVATACVALGHAPERIKTERFGPTGA